MEKAQPFVVAIGGTLRENSSTEKAIRLIVRRCEALGARVQHLSGPDLELPSYAPERPERNEAARRLVDAVRAADAVILGSPGYHGGISGLVKNAIDYIEDLRTDERCYLDGRAVACVATGAGWQGAIATLSSLRAITHALRGWPVPLGVALNTIQPIFSADGECLQPETARTLDAVAEQLMEFVAARAALKVAA
jgi:FMN reductase